jgi:hypothetical protein
MEEAFAAFASDFQLSTAESMVKREKREPQVLPSYSVTQN